MQKIKQKHKLISNQDHESHMLVPIPVLRAVWAALRLESAKSAMASIGKRSELCHGSQPKRHRIKDPSDPMRAGV
jgi:hypothetical protein